MEEYDVIATAPPSLSNMGPAFDAMGLAIQKPCDRVFARRLKENTIEFTASGLTAGLPENIEDNVVVYTAQFMKRELGLRFGMRLHLEKNLPTGSGIGSSAASAAAAAAAVNGLLDKPLPRMEVLRYVIEGERFISGGIHGDNAAPALLGGAVLVRSCEPIDIVQIKVDPKFIWIVVNPDFVIKTKEARAILPTHVPLHDAVQQWANVGSLVHAMTAGDAPLLARSIDDRIIEPVRRSLIRGFDAVKQAALDQGALACTISGSGPSMFAVSTSFKRAEAIAEAMQAAFTEHAHAASQVFISPVNARGTTVSKRRRR